MGNWNFSDKKLWYFSYFFSKHRLWVLVRTASSSQNIDCGYSLEPPRQGGSNEYPQSMFWEEIWKIPFSYFFSKHRLWVLVRIAYPQSMFWEEIWKIPEFFIYISSQNIDCGYSLEPPRRTEAVLTSTHNLCFEAVLTSTHNLCFEKKYEKYLFHISSQSIDCGYSLEPPTHNLCFEKKYE